MTSPLPPARKRSAVVIVVVTAAAWVLVLLAAWNPWGYLRLEFGPYGLAAAVTTLPMAAGGLVLLLVPQRSVRITLAVVSWVAVPVVACGAGGLALWTDPAWKRTVLATSPNGQFQVVRLTDNSLTFREELRIVRPAGWRTRQSRSPLLCVEAIWNNHPKIRVEGARFVSDHEVEVTLDDRTWQTAFAPDSLAPARILDSECFYQGANVERVTS
ncbi:hypothetical protein KZZ52_18800 [Dactylosporangium sp. AC04546]|uniref:hypothetical protein n=1 Tax=Dactylosporangium sp. AC04546 TaxID=2862460 RepID=UPI001EE03120|nr:hypothetical protein [Dactylosporangium sp. AC04546]WVK87353.1 hypothetical protein KZZ52_18800 [Dactylosporangium sp. AC04546]